jgi:CheY-like chemotaxis protein
VDGAVRIYVEDSGPGIPLEKREKLFAKFQESLDSLSQGTGMGLCLCEKLTELLDGELLLDETYTSGIEGCPGSRFVIQLSSTPLDLDSAALDQYESNLCTEDASSLPASTSDNEKKSLLLEKNDVEPPAELPESLSVLVVDDDLVLRKLLSRSLQRIAPTWLIQEAANGETALRMTDTAAFDLIFMDQYMASIEKQLLGTEATRELRARGVQSRICGLSANDLEETFRNAGADTFLIKPFPCEKEALKREMFRILYATTC